MSKEVKNLLFSSSKRALKLLKKSILSKIDTFQMKTSLKTDQNIIKSSKFVQKLKKTHQKVNKRAIKLYQKVHKLFKKTE